MYVCVCVCVCVCMCVGVCESIYISIHVCRFMFIRARKCVLVHACRRTFMSMAIISIAPTPCLLI